MFVTWGYRRSISMLWMWEPGLKFQLMLCIQMENGWRWCDCMQNNEANGVRCFSLVMNVDWSHAWNELGRTTWLTKSKGKKVYTCCEWLHSKVGMKKERLRQRFKPGLTFTPLHTCPPVQSGNGCLIDCFGSLQKLFKKNPRVCIGEGMLFQLLVKR